MSMQNLGAGGYLLFAGKLDQRMRDDLQRTWRVRCWRLVFKALKDLYEKERPGL